MLVFFSVGKHRKCLLIPAYLPFFFQFPYDKDVKSIYLGQKIINEYYFL